MQERNINRYLEEDRTESERSRLNMVIRLDVAMVMKVGRVGKTVFFCPCVQRTGRGYGSLVTEHMLNMC